MFPTKEMIDDITRDDFIKKQRERISPAAILKLAQRNPIVKECMYYWETGYFTWEQALAHALVCMVEQNERNFKEQAKKENEEYWNSLTPQKGV